MIILSFANIKESDFTSARLKIGMLIKNLYSDHLFLLNSEKLTKGDKDFLQKGAEGRLNDTEETMEIYQLSKFFFQHYQRKVIILLDEYDTPMREAYVSGFWNEMASFIRSLFNSTFKTNPYLARGMMTGITRVNKESIFSDLNHLKVVAATSNEYAEAFGFTETEVFAALEECGLGEKKAQVKQWYDGFIFGNCKDIYNPWSIINFLDTGKLDLYWANTSSNSLVSRLLQQSNPHVKSSFEVLLRGDSITCPLDEQIVYSQLDGSEESIWSLLLASGYLTVIHCQNQEELIYGEDALYELTLTNFEVRKMFLHMVRGWFRPFENDYGNFIQALLEGNLTAMNHYLTRISLQCFSYFDTGIGAMGNEPERFYHGFILGLLAELCNRYTLTSNRESGFGRYDVVIEPFDKDKEAFILEFKVKDSSEDSLEATLKTALAQIEEKQYATDLLARGFRKEQIKKYGFAFEGKKVLIG